MTNFLIIVPSLKNSGPVNSAMEYARGLASLGVSVNILHFGDFDSKFSNLDNIKFSKINFLNYFKIFYSLSKSNNSTVLISNGFRPDFFSFTLKILTSLFRFNSNNTHTSFVHIDPVGDIAYSYPTIGVILRPIWFYLWSKFDLLFVLNEFAKNNLSSLQLNYSRPPKLALINNGCFDPSDHTSFHLSSESQYILSKIECAFVGVLNKRKNINGLISLWLTPSFSDLKLNVWGIGPLENDLRKLLGDSNCFKSNIFFHGYSIDPLNTFKGPLILVLPSFSEGCPLVIIEALSLGFPCIVMSGIGLDHKYHLAGFEFQPVHFCGFECANELRTLVQNISKNYIEHSINARNLYDLRFTRKHIASAIINHVNSL